MKSTESTDEWENVFISSTFNDMHAERDYLVKRVFPQLSAWCEERKLRLVDIDLRWGVSEADATENKRVVQVCLDRIDECRPFFLCFLGQRRGWVPAREDIGADTYALFEKLAAGGYAGSASVTEMEILHALIDPLHGGLRRAADGSEEQLPAAEHAFFYLREPGYLGSISQKWLRDIYTNEGEGDPAHADGELRRWREEVIPASGRPAHAYKADWDLSGRTSEIAWPCSIPTTARPGSPQWQSVHRRWAAQWAAAGVTVGPDGALAGAELERAQAFNALLTTGRLSGFEAEGVAGLLLGQMAAAGKLPGVDLDDPRLLNRLPEYLEKAGAAGPTLLVIDGLNQLETGMADLGWLPSPLPAGVKLIVSFKRGEESAEQYYAQFERDGSMRLHGLRAFEEKADREALVRAYLARYFKELDEERIDELTALPGADNPLFLKTVLGELRVFGSHQHLGEVIKTSFGSSPLEAFDALLARMEADPPYAGVPNDILIPRLFGWLAHAQQGLSVEELTGLFLREDLGEEGALRESILVALRQLRPYLAHRGGRADFFYESFLLAARRHGTPTSPAILPPGR